MEIYNSIRSENTGFNNISTGDESIQNINYLNNHCYSNNFNDKVLYSKSIPKVNCINDYNNHEINMYPNMIPNKFSNEHINKNEFFKNFHKNDNRGRDGNYSEFANNSFNSSFSSNNANIDPHNLNDLNLKKIKKEHFGKNNSTNNDDKKLNDKKIKPSQIIDQNVNFNYSCGNNNNPIFNFPNNMYFNRIPYQQMSQINNQMNPNINNMNIFNNNFNIPIPLINPQMDNIFHCNNLIQKNNIYFDIKKKSNFDSSHTEMNNIVINQIENFDIIIDKNKILNELVDLPEMDVNEKASKKM